MSAYQPAKRHPLTLGLIVAAHGGVLAALMLSTIEVPGTDPIKRLIVDHIDAPEPPAPPPPPPSDPQPRTEPRQTESVLDRVVTPVPSPNPVPAVPVPPAPPPVPLPDVPFGDRTVLPPPPAPLPPRPLPQPPAPDPVRVDAVRDPRHLDAFQPPYPDSMRSQGEEGSAVVRVLIGPDGRVKAVEEVRASHDAFMSATVRHARARWRFRPATVDGRPVESWKRMTVTFTLDD